MPESCSPMELHRCRFVNYTPAAISAVAFSPSTYQRVYFACGRANGDIEIWDPASRWLLVKTIPGSANEALETLAWSHQTMPSDVDSDDSPEEIAKEKQQLSRKPPRLFSSGLNALITEWDLDTLRPKTRLDSMGGAVWCIAVNPQQTRLAAGCEDGCVRVFDIADGAFEYLRSFEPTKARILSLAWSKDGCHLVTGSADSAIRKWDVDTGRITLRMTVGKEGRMQTMIWAVLVLADGTIVSGDSLGRVQIWNGDMGTVDFVLDHHSADVLCLAAAEDGVIYSSGVDRKINRYTRVNAQRSAKNPKPAQWILAGSNRPHSHDVRGLDVSTLPSINAVVSGGIGVQLVICRHSSFPKDRKQYLPLNPVNPLIHTATERPWLLSRFDHSVRLWQLGQGVTVNENNRVNHHLGDPLTLKESYRVLLELQLQDTENLLASAISSNGEWIAVATIEQVKLFRILPHPTIQDRWVAKKMNHFPTAWSETSRGAQHLVFSPDNCKLLVATPDYQLVVVDLSDSDISSPFPYTMKSLPKSKSALSYGYHNRGTTIRSLAVSPDGQWTVIGDTMNRIHIYHLDSLAYHGMLPVFSALHTSLTFHPDAQRLFITLANHEMHIYDVESRQLYNHQHPSASSSNSTPIANILARLPDAFRNSREHILGVLFDPKDPNLALLWGNQFIGRIYLDDRVNQHDKQKTTSSSSSSSRVVVVKRNQRKRQHTQRRTTQKLPDESSAAPCVSSDTLAVVLRYQPLLNVSMIGHHQIMVVERPLHHILQQLPASFYEPTYRS